MAFLASIEILVQKYERYEYLHSQPAYYIAEYELLHKEVRINVVAATVPIMSYHCKHLYINYIDLLT
ncbi:hypothetical protein GCM10011418_40090 [Sphingobacterium alkalisoli]|nr:hypothetical protein GCM10011418_40090 [Sphingobacterium alkalisoli]